MLLPKRYEDSRCIVLAHSEPGAAGTEVIPFQEAVGRIAAKAVVARVDDPPAAKSAMDGFAVRAAETGGATAEQPVAFSFSAVLAAGHAPVVLRMYGEPGAAVAPAALEASKAPRQGVRIMTGALLPAGLDAVVKQEDTLPTPAKENEGQSRADAPGTAAQGLGSPGLGLPGLGTPETGAFAMGKPLVPGENIIPRGARFQVGDLLLPAGQPLSPQGVGLLAGQGITTVCVFRRPRIALLAVGDELVPPQEPLAAGQLHVSNLYALTAAARRYGAKATALGICGDDPAEIESRLRAAMAEADVLVTLGGTHRGDFDFVEQVLERLGARLHFRRTRINWGGSTLFATRSTTQPATPLATQPATQSATWADETREIGEMSKKLVFGLPGTPLASWVAFEALVRPALWRLAGRQRLDPPRLQAKLALPVKRPAGRTHFVPAQLVFGTEQHPRAWPLSERPTATHPSSLLANGLIRIDEDGADLPAGEVVPVDWLDA